MNIKTNDSEELWVCDDLSIVEEGIWVSSTQNEHLHFKCYFPLKIHADYIDKPFRLYLFKNQFYAENDIFQIFDMDEKVRMGWVFPLQALVSCEHSYIDNIHFLKYATKAMHLLLKDSNKLLDGPIRLPNVESTIHIDEIYKPDDIVLILSSDSVPKLEQFDINLYLPALYKYGYYRKCENAVFLNKYIKENYQQLNAKIKIRPLVNDTINLSYITTLYSESLIHEKHHLVRFLMLYQIVEMMMECVFKQELKKSLKGLGNLQGGDTVNYYKEREKLLAVTKDKYRLNILFEKVKISEILKTNFINETNNLLNKLGTDQENTAQSALYTLRNILLHGYSNFPKKYENMLLKVLFILEDLLIEMILTYKEK